MLITQKCLVNFLKDSMHKLNGLAEIRFKMSQRSMGIYSYVLGTLSGVMITMLFIKYIQYEELLQQTTRPVYEMSHEPTLVSPTNLHDEVRILCWVLTFPPNHLTKAKAVKNTWGKRCNKLVFISTKVDEQNLGEVMLVNVTEERTYLWGKTKQGLKQIYETYGNDYDWFLKADDDTWIFMENLRHFLYAYSPAMPIYFGCKLKPFVNQGYMSGSGYVLSREAVRRFNEEALVDDHKCSNATEGAEDVEIGKCLGNVGVLAGDSRDDFNRSRFLPFPPEMHMLNLFGESWLDNATFYEIKRGIECCSRSVISFHYINYKQMYIFDFLMYQVKHASNQDKLPLKRDFEEIRVKLLAQSNEMKKNSSVTPSKAISSITPLKNNESSSTTESVAEKRKLNVIKYGIN